MYYMPCLQESGSSRPFIEITQASFRECVQGTAQDSGRFMRHLDASSGALSKQAVTPALPRTPDQARQPFFASATPLEEQQERAMRQVLQEEVF